MKTTHTTFIPVHAIEHASKRRHIPMKGGWKVPVDYIGQGGRHLGYLEVATTAAVLSDRFIEAVKTACRRERERGFVMELRPDGGTAALYARHG